MKRIDAVIQQGSLDEVRERLTNILEAIVRGARTGRIGDGEIFVTPIDEVVRIRTGEIDQAAL
jgi:nitrogen regulatory protein PII